LETRNRHFSREFKVNAVQLVIKKILSVRQVAEDLDIHPNLLTIWKKSNYELSAGIINMRSIFKGKSEPFNML
jgi:transposase-like protein